MYFDINDYSKHTIPLHDKKLTFQLVPISLNTVEMVILAPTTIPSIIDMADCKI